MGSTETNYLANPELKKAMDKAKINLMSRNDSAFFITVCFSLKHIWDDTISTASTNGLDIRFNPEFFMNLDPEERVFLLIHESMHVAYLHMERLKDRDHKKWNIAADHVINLQLIKRGFKMPKGGYADRQYSDLSTEEVYKLLPDPPESFTMDLVPPDVPSDVLQREVEDILVRASIQSKMAGDNPDAIPGDIQIFLNKLLNPKLPWQRILQRYLHALAKTDFTFRRPNRRYLPQYYLPSLHNEKVIDLAIAIDASGSVSDDEFKRFVSEIHGIFKMMKPEKITLIQFDGNIRSVTEIRNLHELSQVEFRGRGGTKIGPVLNWANENKPQLMLVFSDGEFYFHGQETKVNTIWLINNNPGFKAPFGKVIHYEV